MTVIMMMNVISAKDIVPVSLDTNKSQTGLQEEPSLLRELITVH